MKTFVLTLVVLLGLSTGMNSQVSFGVSAGITPAVDPGTKYKLINRSDPANEFTFNVGNVSFDNHFAFHVRHDNDPFWLMLECRYGKSKTEYLINYTQQRPDGASMQLSESTSYLSFPLSIGFKHKVFEVFSGLTFVRILEHSSELTSLNGFSSSISKGSIEWHTGIGINYKFAFAHMRYQQSFRNYGSGRYVNGTDLSLYNLPGQVLFSIGIQF